MIKFELTLREIVLDDDFNEEKQRIVRDCLIFPPNKELHNFLNSKEYGPCVYSVYFDKLRMVLANFRELYTNPEYRDELDKIPWLDIKQGE